MKDKAMMMYSHIRNTPGVEPWAIEELQKVMESYFADSCRGCAFFNRELWEMPCKKCQRNSRDYWRRAE